VELVDTDSLTGAASWFAVGQDRPDSWCLTGDLA